jgi:hypothetical protein
MTIEEALKKAREGKGAVLIRNPLKKGKKAIEFLPL